MNRCSIMDIKVWMMNRLLLWHNLVHIQSILCYFWLFKAHKCWYDYYIHVWTICNIYVFVHFEGDVNKLQMYDYFSDRLFVWLYIYTDIYLWVHTIMSTQTQCFCIVRVFDNWTFSVLYCWCKEYRVTNPLKYLSHLVVWWLVSCTVCI